MMPRHGNALHIFGFLRGIHPMGSSPRGPKMRSSDVFFAVRLIRYWITSRGASDLRRRDADVTCWGVTKRTLWFAILWTCSGFWETEAHVFVSAGYQAIGHCGKWKNGPTSKRDHQPRDRPTGNWPSTTQIWSHWLTPTFSSSFKPSGMWLYMADISNSCYQHWGNQRNSSA